MLLSSALNTRFGVRAAVLGSSLAFLGCSNARCLVGGPPYITIDSTAAFDRVAQEFVITVAGKKASGSCTRAPIVVPEETALGGAGGAASTAAPEPLCTGDLYPYHAGEFAMNSKETSVHVTITLDGKVQYDDVVEPKYDSYRNCGGKWTHTTITVP